MLNGLDNLDARRHVNRLAMAANVPLVESGTAGYLGQVRHGCAAAARSLLALPDPPLCATTRTLLPRLC